MENIKCKYCDTTIEGSTKQLKIRNLIQHLTKNHNEKYIDYIININYDGKRPFCNCGCNNLTDFNRGKFYKYYKDHKNNVIGKYKNPKKIKNNDDVVNSIEKKLQTVSLTIEDIKNFYNDFINYKISLTDIEKISSIDKRTIKSYWKILNFINNNEDFNRVIKKHQYTWIDKNNKRGGKKLVDENILLEIKIFIENNRNKFTIKEIKNKFDLFNYTELVLYKRLCELFGKEYINELLKSGNSSKSEIEYFNILKYFYGNEIKKQFRLENKIYDYILLDKILIEFDGDYWHSLPKNKYNDNLKNDIAIKNGYYLIRIKENESNNIEILNKINETYEKIKINKYNK